MQPMVTTIIPTYRRPALLRRAISSALAQTYPHIRVCVYDNASADETADLVAEFAKRDPRVHYFCHPENVGAFANFSYGLNAVATPLFSFLSDDDVLLPDFYTTAVEQLEQRPDAAFWGGAAIVMSEDGNVKDVTAWPAAYYQPPDGLLEMISNNYMIWTSVMFRTDKVASIGGLDPDVGAPVDTDFMLRLAASFPFLTSPEPAAIWMSHPESSSVLAGLGFIWPGWLKTMRNITEDVRIPADVRARVGHSLTEQLKRQLFQTGYNSIRQNKLDDAREAAGILKRNYGQHARANLISCLAWACQHFPATHRLISIVDRTRRLARRDARHKARDLQLKFGEFARFIRVP